MILLKQSTEVVVRVGPFVDVTDGFTPETGVTLTGGGDNADEAEVLKAAGAATVDISAATWAAVSGCDGWYDLTLTTGFTDTLGELKVVIQNDSVHLPVHLTAMVLPAIIYDWFVAGTDLAWVNVDEVNGSTTAATNMEIVFDTDFGTNYDTTNDVWVVDASGVSVTSTSRNSTMLPTGQVFPTVRYATDDSVDYIITAGDDIVSNREANWALVQCISANDTRFAFDADPTQGAGGLGHDLSNNDAVILLGRAQVEQFRYTSSTNASASAIQVTFGWNPGYA